MALRVMYPHHLETSRLEDLGKDQCFNRWKNASSFIDPDWMIILSEESPLIDSLWLCQQFAIENGPVEMS